MAIISHHLHSVVRASRIVAVTSFITFAVSFLFVGAMFHAGRLRPEYLPWALAALVGLYVVPGALLWFLAGSLEESGRAWAFILIAVLAVFDVLKVAIATFSTPPCISLPLRLPTLYLAACCLNAAPDVRDLYRQRRRNRLRRGFEPIMTGRPAAVKPPPVVSRQAPGRREPTGGAGSGDKG